MRFKEWVLLNELQYVTMPKPVSINGVMTDGIDFRFEDWGKGYNLKKRNVLRPAPSGASRFVNSSFSAPLKDGSYLNVEIPNGGNGQTMGNLSLAVSTEKVITVEDQPTQMTLPSQWYDFAIFYLGNRVVKSPEWPRHKSETGTMIELE